MLKCQLVCLNESGLGSPAQLGKLDLSGFRLKAVPISAGFALIAKAEKEIKGLAGRLGNPNFADKAPPEVVAECKAKLAEAEAQADLARRRLADLG